jgi:hypothetical protein
MKTSRRNFLKVSTAGTAGLAIGGIPALSEASSNGWINGKAINPNISNTRIVCCYDTKMFKSTPGTTFASQNTAVNSAQVSADMDAMAMSLAQKATADEAWKTIFMSSKSWAATKVAIKVNCVASQNMPRMAIINKLCRELGKIGVAPANIIIYDGCSNANSGYSSYCSLTDTTKTPAVVSNGNGSLGGTTSIPVPGLSGNYVCTAQIANGTIDILINVSVNKGHTAEYGTQTMCMKNHYGTFTPIPIHGTAGLFAINKCAAIVGGNPVRQQLCIVDSLLANGISNADATLYSRIAMGTLAPIVDYACVKNIREKVMNRTHNATVVNRFLSDFGYASTDVVWVDVPPASTTVWQEPVERLDRGHSRLEIALANGAFKPASVFISLPHQSDFMRVSIFDMKGSLVRDLDITSFSERNPVIKWDARDRKGSTVSAGNFIIRVIGRNFERSGTLLVSK